MGPLLFNIFMCGLFIILEETDFASYEDDNTPFVCQATRESVARSLESCSASLLAVLLVYLNGFQITK